MVLDSNIKRSLTKYHDKPRRYPINNKVDGTLMNSYEWLLYAGIAVWSGLGLYLCLLARRQQVLSKRLRQLSLLLEEEDS